MYAAGSSSSSSGELGSPPTTSHHHRLSVPSHTSLRHKLRSNGGILKCFILTPNAKYVNPIFADLFATTHAHDSHESTDDPNASAPVRGDDANDDHHHHHVVDAAALSSDASDALRSPLSLTRSTSTFSSSPPKSSTSPSSSLLKHVLVPTPPHSSPSSSSTAAAEGAADGTSGEAAASTPATSKSREPSTLASAASTPGSADDTNNSAAPNTVIRNRHSLDCGGSWGSPQSMYHSLLHPSPINRSSRAATPASYLMSPLSTATMTSDVMPRSESKPPISFCSESASLSVESASISALSMKASNDTSLGSLVKRFVNLVQSNPNGTVDLTMAVSKLGVGKRRIYDVTNVLEGIGLIRKGDRNHFEWVDPDPDDEARAVGNVNLQMRTRVDDLRREVQDFADEEQRLDLYLDFLHQQSTRYMDAPHDVHNSSKASLIRHMYVRYSDVTHLYNVYGCSDTIIGIKAPAGTNLEVPDPERGMEVGKRRYQMYLSSKLPDGSYPLGAVDNRGPIRVYLVRPDAKPGDSIVSRPGPRMHDVPAHSSAPKHAPVNPSRTQGSYVESESVSASKPHDATPIDRGPKRPYAQSTHAATQPYMSPLYGPHHPSPYSYYSDVSTSPWSHHPYYFPSYYPPVPAPTATTGELITPDNDSKPPPAKLPKRKRSSLPVPAGGPPSPPRRPSPLDPSNVAPWTRPASYGAATPDASGHGASTYRPAFLTATSAGPSTPYWQRPHCPDVATAASGSPMRLPHSAGRHHVENQDAPSPSSPHLSPAAVDPSELFSMPLHSPPGPRQESSYSYGGGGVGTADRSIVLSPGASAPPGFSPRRTYSAPGGPIQRSLPDPVRLPFPSLPSTSPPRRNEMPYGGNKNVKTKKRKAKSDRSSAAAVVDPIRRDAYHHGPHHM